MHANARLTTWARREIVRRHTAGVTQAEIARQMRVSRDTVSKWWRRYLADPEGEWFVDRSSRPLSCPHRTPAELEAAIISQRQLHRLGPARIGYRLEVPSSTVWKVLRRNGLNRLAWFDRATGARARRYEKQVPGELIHLDTKQVARIPEGGGWWAHGILRTRPYRPQTNGKVERFNRTLTDEWAYARPYTSEAERTQALQDWIHSYNHHRGHTAIGGPPISRVDNLLAHTLRVAREGRAE